MHTCTWVHLQLALCGGGGCMWCCFYVMFYTWCAFNSIYFYSYISLNLAYVYKRQRTKTPQEMKRNDDMAQEKEVSWLTVIPRAEYVFTLHKGDFRDAIHIQYNWSPPRLPSQYAYGQGFTVLLHTKLFCMQLTKALGPKRPAISCWLISATICSQSIRLYVHYFYAFHV